MRVAVVGCGYWGSKHARVLRGLPGVEHLALVDPDEGRARALGKLFGEAPCYTALDEALPSVDAVVVATPPTTHAELALTAIDAGRHVLVEKPLATSSASAQRMIDAAEEAGVVLMVGHTFEYNPAVRALREVVRNDGLGKLHYIDTARLNLGLYQLDVNVIWDLAPHDVSIINFLLDASPTTVDAWGSSYAHSTLEDVAFIRLQYENDMCAHVHVSWLDPSKVRRVTVVGSQKMAVFNDLADEERLRIYDKGVVQGAEEDMVGVPMSYRYGDIRCPFIHFEEPLMLQDRHFVECCRDGRRPRTDGRNGLAVVRVLEAANEALREGGQSQPSSNGHRMAGVTYA